MCRRVSRQLWLKHCWAHTNMNNTGPFWFVSRWHGGGARRKPWRRHGWAKPRSIDLAWAATSSTQAQAAKLSKATSPSSSSRLATILKGKLQTATNKDQWGAPTKNKPNSKKMLSFILSQYSYYVLINMPPGKTNGWNPQSRFSSEEFPFQFGADFQVNQPLDVHCQRSQLIALDSWTYCLMVKKS